MVPTNNTQFPTGRHPKPEDEPVGIISPDEGDAECVECGRPLDPHEWAAGYRTCRYCEVILSEFQRLLEQVRIDEQLPPLRD